MNTKGRKLLRCAAGFITAAVLIVAAYTTTAMASGIGLIDTADLLDIHAEADDSSAVVGQVMDEGRVAILGRSDGWVQIQAGEMIGWVPENNLIETEESNEEAVEANEELFAEITENAESTEENTKTEESLEEALSADASEEMPEAQTDIPTEEPEGSADGQDEEDAEMSAAEAGGQEILENTAAQAQQFALELQKEVNVQEQTAEAAKEAEAQAAETAAKEAEAKAAEAAKEAEAKAAEAAAKEAEARAAEAAAKEAEAAEAAAKEAEAQAAEAAAKEAEAAAMAEEARKAQEAAALEAQRQAQAAAEAAELENRKQSVLASAGVTEEELYLLASIIYCEAGGEPYIGKVAVGNVVMNRVKSEKQPDTISEVVYARGQFSPVSNGSLARALQRGSADASCYEAALEALEGANPVGDKLYFRRVNGRSGQVIGHHVFY